MACARVQPFGRLLEQGDAPQLLAQVTHDITAAIHSCASVMVAQRDVTPNNIMEHKGRGVLLDFSAARVLRWVSCTHIK